MSFSTIAPSPKSPASSPGMASSIELVKPVSKSKKSRKPTGKSSSSSSTQANPGIKKAEKLHRRSRSGCFTCRLRRKKCDEGHPACRACKNLKLRCEYERPMWWGNNEQRKSQKEYIKDLIKSTKMNEKTVSCPRQTCCTYSPPGLSHSAPTPEAYPDTTSQTRDTSLEPPYCTEGEPSHVHIQEFYDPYAQDQPSHLDSNGFWSAPTPYEVDVKTESELFINDIPTRRDSSTSTFNTFQPPLAHAMLPSFAEDDWARNDVFDSKKRGGVFADVILPAIESNKCYLHCCLSIAAAHLKSTQQVTSDFIDNDILKHRFQAVSELCSSLNQDTDHLQILEATLSMAFFQCAVGRANDTLPDVPWHQHFQAATGLIHKLDLPHRLLESDHGAAHPPFSMSLAAWIDILGSTMLGQMPQFAHTYRTKLFGGSSAGLCELMGCEDRVMYLIAEISCLDALCIEGRTDHASLCGHVTNLAQQLDHTEPPAGSLVKPFSENGVLLPQQLAKNITALFRVAARVYLCSLVPGSKRDQPGTVSLISHAAELLDLIPSGPEGFDTSLVWPLLICGSLATPGSTFRETLGKRIEQMGQQAELGSFGRMVCVLQEVWRLADEKALIEAEQPTSFSQRSNEELPLISNNIVRWRDVMQQNGWDFLLI
ncbi:C6 sexual development transcription factor NosA [Trichophyton equinum CBS 127.97]|uniref:C6 sexual development transcription factor NosA n=1 Tax=Trichophyton equinum (strain ATCC MYA-4606 / CBS 127.97) TaxID=559882 RepID=F2PJP2_TRIEC|nr:C6 sexual development transcription factor NosA [Trichophyton equinum CBS 127.97]